VYTKFVKYTREVSSGRRVVTLENILEFATGASEEPPLGFTRFLNIQFIEVDNKELTTTENEVSILLFVFSPFSCHIVIINCYFTINKIFTEGEVITSLYSLSCEAAK
jgi:hypothetical protein